MANYQGQFPSWWFPRSPSAPGSSSSISHHYHDHDKEPVEKPRPVGFLADIEGSEDD